MAKPTLIFAPGAWYPPTAFDPLIEKLASDGYKCYTVAFPSIQQATEVKDLSLDIAAIRAFAEPAADAGEEVVLVVHSWAGLPVSSALEGLSRTHREKDGKTGGVIKICYISAFIPEVGQSLLDAVGGVPPDWWIHDVSPCPMCLDCSKCGFISNYPCVEGEWDDHVDRPPWIVLP